MLYYTRILYELEAFYQPFDVFSMYFYAAKNKKAATMTVTALF
jgi:hypothetical protein